MYLNEEQPKLTDWENEPTLEALKKDFRASKQFHDNQLSKINHWQDLLYVKGTEQPASVKGRSKVQPKLIRRQAEWRYSALSEPFLSSDRIFQVIIVYDISIDHTKSEWIGSMLGIDMIDDSYKIILIIRTTLTVVSI